MAVPSASLEARCALLAEGRDALHEVVARSRLGLQLRLELELRLQIVREALRHCLLSQAVGEPRTGCELGCESRYIDCEGGILEHLVDEAHALRLLGGNGFGAEHQGERELVTDQPRQDPGAA